jgi:hypothetical protein
MKAQSLCSHHEMSLRLMMQVPGPHPPKTRVESAFGTFEQVVGDAMHYINRICSLFF